MDTRNNMGELQVHYTKWKQPDLNGNTVYYLHDILKNAQECKDGTPMLVKDNYKEAQGNILGCRK